MWQPQNHQMQFQRTCTPPPEDDSSPFVVSRVPMMDLSNHMSSRSHTPPPKRGFTPQASFPTGATPRNGCYGGFEETSFNSYSNHPDTMAAPMFPAQQMCTPQVSRQETDFRSVVDQEVTETNCRSRGKLPDLVTQISDRIFLGGLPCADSVKVMQGFGITHVINVSNEQMPRHLHQHFDEVCFLPTRDEADYYILENHLGDFTNEMQRMLSYDGARIYVHCIAGVNRSVTLLCAYMIQNEGFELIDAIRHFRSAGRLVILENRGFREQLAAFQLELNGQMTGSCHFDFYEDGGFNPNGYQ